MKHDETLRSSPGPYGFGGRWCENRAILTSIRAPFFATPGVASQGIFGCNLNAKETKASLLESTRDSHGIS